MLCVLDKNAYKDYWTMAAVRVLNSCRIFDLEGGTTGGADQPGRGGATTAQMMLAKRRL
jgi:hypothetical protein